jgi:hypothetical protein
VLATAGFFLTRGHHGLDETPLPAAPGAALRADVVLAPHAVAPIARATPPATAEVQTSLHGALISARNRDAVTPGIVAVTPLGAGQMFVEHSPASATISVAVDSLGLFSFSKLSPGRYWLDASAPGYARETRVVHVPLATAVIIPLRDAAFVTGEDGAPVAQAEVLAISAANEVRGESDSSGAFSLEVAPGMAGVFAHKNSLSGRLEFPVEAKAGESVKGLHLVLRNGTTLSGRVHGDDGKAIAGAQLALSLESERRAVSLREGISDREGNFVFDGLAPGKYELDALANGYARGNAVHVIVTSATSRVDVVLHRAAALEGNVTDPSGAPIAGAVVQFFGSRDDETATDRDGHYAFADLEAGQAIVAAHRREETVGASQKIALMGGETTHQDLRLGDLTTLHGVVHWKSGPPVDRSVRVNAMPSSGVAKGGDTGSAETDTAGNYAIHLPPGDYLLSARPIGWVMAFNTSQGVPTSLARATTSRSISTCLKLARTTESTASSSSRAAPRAAVH